MEEPELSLEERARRADLWDAAADERERLADEREYVADEREALSDQRDLLADRHENELDRRESAQLDPAHPDAAQSAVRRAEAGIHRAEAQLLRAQQIEARVAARAAREAAGTERAVAAEARAADLDDQERAWLADRRDFIAAVRAEIADQRDRLADEREAAADERERLAGEREREALDRERRLDRTAVRPAEALRDKGIRRPATVGARARAQAEWPPDPYGPMLLSGFAEIARRLIGADDLTGTLNQILRYTVRVLTHCHSASVTLWSNDRALPAAATGRVPVELDEAQFASGSGPALDALHADSPEKAPRFADSDWPELTAAAEKHGVVGGMFVGLFVHQPTEWSPLGVLSLYSDAVDGFEPEDEEFASILAAYIAVSVAMERQRNEVERREAALHRSLSTRDIIGQAKGILMERRKLSAGEAFDVLRRVSQRLNVKLAEVAQHLTETGELPPAQG
jgi:hypothetical protein